MYCLVSVVLAQILALQPVSRGPEWRAQLQSVMIDAGGGHGVGVVVGEDTNWFYILTAFHVVYKNENQCPLPNRKAWFLSPMGLKKGVNFDLKKGVNFEIVPGAFDQQRDLTAIQVLKSELKGFPLHFAYNLARDPSILRRGDHLFMVQNSDSLGPWNVPAEPFFFAGLRVLPPDSPSKDLPVPDGPQCEHDPQVQRPALPPTKPSLANPRASLNIVIEYGPGNPKPGASGGPLCNADGEIVGLVKEASNESTSAEPITKALRIYRTWNLPEPRLFAEHRFPILKPHYTEIGADAALPAFTGGLSSDGPGAGFHITHGITRSLAATFDTTILYAKDNYLGYHETQQILIPNGGLQLQPFAGLARRLIHETLGGVYIGGGLGWAFVSRSIETGAQPQNLSSLMLSTEIGYRLSVSRGWGWKASYKVFQPLHSQGVERADGITLGLYCVFR